MICKSTSIHIVCCLLLMLAVCSASAASARSITLETLLAEMVDRAAVARWPQPEFTCREASSYDRTRTGPDRPGWFANHDFSQYMRAETHAGRTEQVMLDADGPGAIVRFWLTSNNQRQGKLHFYFDGSETANLEIPAYDLMASQLTSSPLLHPHTSYDPKGGGGSTLYLPIPYARHCKITWEAADSTSTAPRYYQINYRTYPAGTAVETFTLRRLQAAAKTLARVNKLLTDTSSQMPEVDTGGVAAAKSSLSLSADASPVSVATGASVSLALPAGAHAVHMLEMHVTTEHPEDREQALRSTVVQMEFDGEQTVWCPLGDFAGCGVGARPLQSWYRTVDGEGRMHCRWVMSYAHSGRITLTNLGKTPVAAAMTAQVSPWHWDDRSLHFHATWRHQAAVPTKPDSDWNFVQIQGQGILVGDVQTVFNPVAAWYGEGNEKIWVDNESFPSHLGTGTEDYYNASWAPTPVYQTPFANAPRIDDPNSKGNNTNTRTRNLDTIPFHQALRFDMEIIHWQDPKIDIGAVTYWYARPGATSNRIPMPEEAIRPLTQLPPPFRIANALECEDSTLLSKTEDMFVGPQQMAPFAGQWSNGAHLLGKAGKPGDFVVLHFAVPDGRHRLVLYATKAPDYGILKFAVNGLPTQQEFDGYAPQVQPSGKIDLGIFTATEGQLRLRIEVSGANSASTGARYYFGLDCLTLEAAD